MTRRALGTQHDFCHWSAPATSSPPEASVPVELGARDEEMYQRLMVALTRVVADVTSRPLAEAAVLVNEHTSSDDFWKRWREKADAGIAPQTIAPAVLRDISEEMLTMAKGL